MAKFVLQLAFDRDNERRLAVRDEHRAYLCALLERGALSMAGPWADDSGALIVYEAADEAAARALLAVDPYTTAGVVTVASLREWRPLLPEEDIPASARAAEERAGADDAVMTEHVTLTKQELTAALRASADEAIATIRGLPPDAFTRVCYAGGWTGREIVAHLAAIEWTYPRLIDLAQQAVRQPNTEEASDDAGMSAAPSGGIDAYNARQVAKRAGASLDELLDEFARNRAATIAAVEAMDDALLAMPIRSAGGIAGPLADVLRWIAVDHVLGHVRDIAAGA